MPRYIDADVLYKETEKKIKANNENRMAVVDGEFLDLINDAPTEDVVPRSEVERLEAETEAVRRTSYKQGAMDLAKSIKNYYSNLGDSTLCSMVVFSVDMKLKDMLGEEICNTTYQKR